MKIVIYSMLGALLAIFIVFIIATIAAWMDNVANGIAEINNRLPAPSDNEDRHGS